MARIKFEDIQDAGLSNSNQGTQVGFFSLKNDGDEAIVRIMHDDTDSFDIVSTHAISVGGKYRRVNCCRSPREAVENCPLCASGNPSQQRFYIHLIQYTRDENGQIVPEAKIWERSLSYATTIKNLIVEYGPLSNLIFKIKRNGAAGSMDTKYTIMYANPQMYPENLYPPVPNAFDGYNAIGNVVMDKTPQEIVTFLTEGEFPAIQVQKPDLKSLKKLPVQKPIIAEPGPVPTPVYTQKVGTTETTATITRPQRYY